MERRVRERGRRKEKFQRGREKERGFGESEG